MDKKVLQIFEKIKALDYGHQQELIMTLFGGFDEKERIQWFDRICRLSYPEKRWQELERWMEGQFRRDMSRKPRTVASMGANYFRINSKMMPFILRIAQRVKLRVRLRILRNHPEQDEEQG